MSNLGGRPAIGEPVKVRLPAQTVAWLNEQAEAEGVSRAEIVRRVIARAAADEPAEGES